MYKFSYPGIKLPEIMVCERRSEAQEAAKTGMPYVIRPRGWTDKQLLGAFVFRMLKDRFPDILWDKFLGISEKKAENMVVYTEVDDTIFRETEGGGFDGDSVYDGETAGEQYSEYRSFAAEGEESEPSVKAVSFDEFFKDSTEYIKLEKLMELGMLPQFMSDTIKAIEVNLSNNTWQDGWSKKLQAPVGEYAYSENRDNLIILDISGSIPRGVSSTMLGIVDMLRTNCAADLIITGGTSEYFDKDEELDRPEVIRARIGLGNEAYDFAQILVNHILGRQWGNVIVFGDQDTPWTTHDGKSYFDFDHVEGWYAGSWLRHIIVEMQPMIKGTEVSKLLCYDLRNNGHYKCIPGYGRWAEEFADSIEYVAADEWTTFMRMTY